MSSTSNIGTVCTRIQESLDNVLGTSSPMMKRTKTGAIDALLSPINLQANSFEGVDMNNGTKRGRQYTYMQRAVQADVDESIGTTCTSSTTPSLTHIDHDVTECSSIKFTMDMDYVSKLCEGTASFKMRLLMTRLNALCEQINAKTLTQLNTAFGANQANSPASANAITIDLIDQSNKGQVNANELTTWHGQLVNSNQFGDAPIVIASGDFWKYNKLQNVGCCNDLGQDMAELGAQNGYYFFNDQQIDSEIGTNHAVVFDPGSLHFDTFLRYRNQPGAQGVLDHSGGYFSWQLGDGAARGLFRDPRSNMVFDFRIERECNDNYYMELFLQHSVLAAPTDMYASGDTLAGSNGVLHYIFT